MTMPGSTRNFCGLRLPSADAILSPRSANMTGNYSWEDQQPVTRWGGYAIYATTLLVIVHIVCFVAIALLIAAQTSGWLAWLSFSSGAIFALGAVWQFVTYAFIHSPAEGIWFAIEMFLLFQFGREVERFLGRRTFLQFYAGLLLLVPAVLTVIGLFLPLSYAGSGALHFAILVAFAAIYPNTAFFFGVTAKWIAIILLAIYTLQGLAFHSWAMLIALWTSAGAAWAFIAHQRGQFTLPSLRLPARRPKLSVVREAPLPRRSPPVEDASAASVDLLLDKIAQSGIASLSAKERATLEKAREALLKKETRGR